jgi:hypothetical protein
MPIRRTTQNGLYKYIPAVSMWAWAVILGVISVAVLAGETRMQVKSNTNEIVTVRQQQDKVRESLLEQAQVNGRIDERTESMQRQLSTIIQQLRDPN